MAFQANSSVLLGGWRSPGWVSSSSSWPTLPHPQVREDFAPSFPHRPAFFLCHYHPVKQRGQSGSIWITLTIAYYLGQDCPHSPPPAPTAAVAGPLGTQLPPPPPLVSQGLQGTTDLPYPPCAFYLICFFLTWLAPLPDLMKTSFPMGAWLSEVPGLLRRGVDLSSDTPVVQNTKSFCFPVNRGCGLQ